MADGSIIIDTKIDPKGANAGMKSIGSSLGGVLRSVMGVAKVMGAAFIGGSIINSIRGVVSSFDFMSSSIGASVRTLSDSFGSLKGAFVNLIATAFAPLIPYITTFVSWLIGVVTLITQVIAALFGMQATVGGIASAASSGAGAASKAADKSKKAAKEAKGALASFDQINVLQTQPDQAQPETPPAGGGGGGIPMPSLPSSVIPPELLASIQDFKDKALAFLKPLTDALGRLKDALIPLGQTIWEGLKWAWDNILVPLGTWVITDALPAFLDLLGAGAGVLNEALIALQPLGIWLWENFLKPLGEWTGSVIIEALQWLADKLNLLSDWIKENPEKFQAFVVIIALLVAAWALANVIVGVWAAVSGIATIATTAFAAAMAFLTSPVFLVFLAIVALIAIIYVLIKYWSQISEAALAAWEWIKETWKAASEWFKTSVSEPLKNGFMTALDAIKSKFESIFTGIKTFIKGVINGIIDLINGMIAGIVSGINSIVGAANAVAAFIPGSPQISLVSAPQIPHLATGAVIPPNAQFAAVLGDQRSGRNIEAPEGLIRQIVSEEIGKIDANITVSFAGSLAGLVRELKPYIDKESVRIGGSLVKGKATI